MYTALMITEMHADEPLLPELIFFKVHIATEKLDKYKSRGTS
jgi:hypothetical protein